VDIVHPQRGDECQSQLAAPLGPDLHRIDALLAERSDVRGNPLELGVLIFAVWHLTTIVRFQDFGGIPSLVVAEDRAGYEDVNLSSGQVVDHVTELLLVHRSIELVEDVLSAIAVEQHSRRQC